MFEKSSDFYCNVMLYSEKQYSSCLALLRIGVPIYVILSIEEKAVVMQARVTVLQKLGDEA